MLRSASAEQTPWRTPIGVVVHRQTQIARCAHECTIPRHEAHRFLRSPKQENGRRQMDCVEATQALCFRQLRSQLDERLRHVHYREHGPFCTEQSGCCRALHIGDPMNPRRHRQGGAGFCVSDAGRGYGICRLDSRSHALEPLCPRCSIVRAVAARRFGTMGAAERSQVDRAPDVDCVRSADPASDCAYRSGVSPAILERLFDIFARAMLP